MKATYTIQELAQVLGITARALQKRAKSEGWPHNRVKSKGGRGGLRWVFELCDLPPDVRSVIVKKGEEVDKSDLNLPFKTALESAERTDDLSALTIEEFDNPKNLQLNGTHLSSKDLENESLVKWLGIVREALSLPKGWKKRKWVEAVAVRHDISWQQIYKKIEKYGKKGAVGLRHSKSNKGQPRQWSEGAVDFWLGLVLKREHRKISKKKLFEILKVEASRRNWRIGSYKSCLWWINERVTPQLLALQRGGLRALDNTLPPVLRDYSDLQPFEILVGDQHRFDFWVTDGSTGQVFRPEGYLWQDLRTRCFYGAGFDRKYDSHLMGLALRAGLKLFGTFDNIYTDHGRPEESRYITDIMQEMRDLGLHIERTVDIPVDLSGTEPEDVNPSLILPGTHRKAIVKNAKAKMVEGSFSSLEEILRSQFMVPGSVKILSGSQEENEVDQKDLERLAASGKLLTFNEFVLTVFKGLDYYNSKKPHRGVLKEWIWRPKPKSTTPMDCLKGCYAEGWRPVRLTADAIDLIFLARGKRSIDRGRIIFRNELYENEKLDRIHLQKNEKVDIKFDPLDPGFLLVFHRGEYVCQAEPVEYSSMKDQSLAKRKIEEKRRRRKVFVQEYRELTSHVPDFREYSTVPAAEKAAALIGKEKIEKRKEIEERIRVRTPEELEEEVARIENWDAALEERKQQKQIPLPQRPEFFYSNIDRYIWATKFKMRGGILSQDDENFRTEHESSMSEDQLEYWKVVQEFGETESGERKT